MEIKWKNTKEEAIPMWKQIIAGLWVYNSIARQKFFEKYLISIDESGNIYDEYEEYFTAWNIEDFEYWHELPSNPV